MKKYEVTDIRWANSGDLSLPFWKKWNEQNPLPNGFWQRIWEYPYVSSRIPKNAKSIDIGGTYPFVLFPNFPECVSVDIRDLNELDHPYHKGLWPKDKLIISDASSIPEPDNQYDYAFSISALEEMPETYKVIKELIRLAKYRVVFTMDISEKLGFPNHQLRELEREFNIRIPPIPVDALYSTSPTLKKFNQSSLKEYEDIRVLGITIDSRDEPKSIGIVIPHWESWTFLKPCLESIKTNHSDKLFEHVYVIDDDSKDGSYEKARKFYQEDNSIEFHQVIRPNKQDADVGYLLDYGVKLVKEQYVAMIDADLLPLCNEWLTFPIWLLEKNNCSSVGLDTGLSFAYHNEPIEIPWALPTEGTQIYGGLYDNQAFTITNNLYRVIPSSVAKVVAESIGFSRGITRSIKKHGILQRGINRTSKLLSRFLGVTHFSKIKNPRYPYLPENCDNGVAANQFIDINHLGPKFNIPLTSYIGLTDNDGAFGQNICDLVFHFALSTRALSKERREVLQAGEQFNYWISRLKTTDKIDEKTIDEMISASRVFKPGGYDGSIPTKWYQDEYNYIDSLKKEFREKVGKS